MCILCPILLVLIHQNHDTQHEHTREHTRILENIHEYWRHTHDTHEHTRILENIQNCVSKIFKYLMKILLLKFIVSYDSIKIKIRG